MKAKVILYGWTASWICLFAGVGTMDFPAREDGSTVVGFLLIGVWVVFSLLLIANETSCGREAEKLEKWIDKILNL